MILLFDVFFNCRSVLGKFQSSNYRAAAISILVNMKLNICSDAHKSALE